MAGLEEFAVDVTGGKLGVCRFGDGASRAPSVVAVHGITSNNHVWLSTARALDGRTVLIAPDLRGRAASRKLPGPFGMSAHAADLLALLDQLELQRPVLVGHSLGAFIVSQFAVENPRRASAVVLVDGGLPIPGAAGADPQEFADAFLGPALARLRLRFRDREAYLDWWHQHPAFASSDIAEADLAAYVDHDTVGVEPELHSSVTEESVRADAVTLALLGDAASELSVPARLLCAPKGLLNDPHPMQPFADARAWAAGAPDRRTATLIEDSNHYTIVFGAMGSRAVAEAILGSLRA